MLQALASTPLKETPIAHGVDIEGELMSFNIIFMQFIQRSFSDTHINRIWNQYTSRRDKNVRK
ncbi:MAG TPA: hypothetical protein VEF53_09350 [Patescibacteria group bacterium]|nr:hypothetical protein [Patescibacteria group bacterium]